MRLFALCSWYDEQPEHLERMVRSFAGLVDVFVAVDGAYGTYPDAQACSEPEQADTLLSVCLDLKVPAFIYVPPFPWQGGEVEKRAYMFEYARKCGATPDDWFIIFDGDMSLAPGFNGELIKGLLEQTDKDTAELLWLDVPWDEDYERAARTYFRSLFRALPGLTVEGYHWIYTCYKDGKRYFPWMSPDKRFTTPPALNLTQLLTMEHRQAQRDPERDKQRRAYYDGRDNPAAPLEFIPDYSADAP